MINFRFGWLLLLLSATATWGAVTPNASDETAFTAEERAQGFVNGRVLVKRRADLTTADARYQDAEGRAGITNRHAFRHLPGQHVLEFDRTKSVPELIQQLRATGLYEIVESDRIIHSRVVPNDPSFSQQWSLNNTGQSSGTAGADIGAPAAWDTLHDASSVVVAIIDSGIRLTHTDLAANLWTNPTPNNSGFLNDLHGINTTISRTSSSSGVPTDNNGHGTHVAGTIGAIGNNGVGVTGVAWGVQLMALKFLDSSGNGTTSNNIACIDYAIAHGVSVINASYGSSVFSSSEFDAIQRARSAGIIFVAAAGNDSANTDLGNDYPAAYELDNIVTVAATTRTDALASYSNYGAGSVDLAAPGSEILSTYNTSDTAYETLSGTSMATPHVTGALALLKARFPGDTYRQLINRLLRAVTPLPGLAGKVQSGGRLNLAHALALDPADNRPFNDSFSARATLTGTGVRVRSSNVGATSDAGEPVHAGVAGGASLWWTWTSPSNGQAVFDTSGSSYDTLLAIYTGTALANLQPAASNDDESATIATSRVSLNVTAGTTYQIAVDGKNGASGLTMLRVNVVPANDSFASAQLLTGASATVSATTLSATRETGEPNPANAGAGHSVWYRWIAPATGHYNLAAFSAETNAVAGIYTGSSVSALTLVAANDNASSSNSDALVPFDATAGTTYYFVVDSALNDGSNGGSFTLTLTDSLWQYPAADEVTSSPAVAPDGTVYFGSLDGFVYALNPDGTRKWRSATSDQVDLSTPAIGPDGTIFVCSTDGILYALNPATGSKRWRFTTTSSLLTSPAIAADGTIYVRDDTNLYALTSGTSSATKKWSVALSGGTYASPSIGSDGTIYVGAAGGSFYAINPDGTTRWTFTASNDIYTTPAIAADGTVYFATLSGTVYAFTSTGTKKWTWSVADGSGITSSPAVGADGTLYFGAYDHKLHALRSDGTEAWTSPLGDEVRASSPVIADDGTIYLGCYDSQLYAINPDGTRQRTFATAALIRSSPVIAGGRLYFGSSDAKLYAFDLEKNAASSAWPMFHQNALRNGRVTAPTIVSQPASQTASAGSSLILSAAATGTPAPTYQWQFDGSNLSGATGSTLTLSNLQPANAGLYSVAITSGATTSTSSAIVGLASTGKVIGTGTELQPVDIHHPNGNIFDQVLLTGSAATITADAGQATRISFIDLTDDIVQIEFSGAGSLSIVLDSPTGPAVPVNYNQPTVAYMKGHAGLVITGADETTNLGVFSVGRATAFDPTGTYNILLAPGPTNNPAGNGSSLFTGHDTTNYDGMADIAFVAISSANGKFGGIRTANGSYFATRGLTGVYAPGVQFTGPVFIGDINAAAAATPVILLGSATDTRINGGDLFQSNGAAVQVSGVTQLKFVANLNSNGVAQAAQTNQAHLQQNGADVTAQVVVNPAP